MPWWTSSTARSESEPSTRREPGRDRGSRGRARGGLSVIPPRASCPRGAGSPSSPGPGSGNGSTPAAPACADWEVDAPPRQFLAAGLERLAGVHRADLQAVPNFRLSGGLLGSCPPPPSRDVRLRLPLAQPRRLTGQISTHVAGSRRAATPHLTLSCACELDRPASRQHVSPPAAAGREALIGGRPSLPGEYARFASVAMSSASVADCRLAAGRRLPTPPCQLATRAGCHRLSGKVTRSPQEHHSATARTNRTRGEQTAVPARACRWLRGGKVQTAAAGPSSEESPYRLTATT
jgi:hypothetical protein